MWKISSGYTKEHNPAGFDHPCHNRDDWVANNDTHMCMRRRPATQGSSACILMHVCCLNPEYFMTFPKSVLIITVGDTQTKMPIGYE